ncbi:MULTISPECIES: PadR family transcriptional regulator [unclassified Spirosoma]|uniref:PadR family transcriptional regulator n=1 Tax=unclassified Spirosoma TaxID=2621999 RepID=UPI00095CAF77|nr:MULTISPECIES: PadR family transcriptional regulator [unclassified Spirosoma]MBN8826583.1 helix-turn-helix transcriptional regulator [Spirosoma sp.]OJW72844.1 MAG: PadR family transcriptional regulator [Spirosoma sp. 48-14]
MAIQENPNKELVAAAMVPLVLSILTQQENYGYEIIRQVRELSGGKLDLAEGTLYPVLRKLEQRGLVESFWQTAQNDRHRKYYRLKEQGRETLAAERTHWNLVNQLLQHLWTPNPSLT